jgi:hypothetical protein
MKKILFLFFLSLCAALHADQLEWISLEQAKKAKTFLETQQEIIEYRACDDNPSYKTLKINQVEYRYTGTENYYQIYLLGKNEEEKDEEWATDLAYLYFKEKESAQNVGKYLNFECDPCTEPFEWGKDPRIVEPNILGEWQNYSNQKFDSHKVNLVIAGIESGRVNGQVSIQNIKTKQKSVYFVEGNISKEGVARLEVIERSKKGSFSLAWIEVSLQGENLHWEKESGDSTVFPDSINLTKNDSK